MEKDYLIEKWLKDELSDAEMRAFNALDDAALNEAIIKDAKLFKASNFSKPHDFELLEERLQPTKSSGSFNFYKSFMRVAAAVLIGLGVYFGVFNNQLKTVQTLVSEMKSITLPDNSEVTLNALSQISYSEKKWNDERSLTLDGEAFFDVEKGKQFEVETLSGTVTVLGTEFSVKHRQDYFEVICYEGSVRVTSQDTSTQLRPGEAFKIINDIFMEGTTANAAPSWLRNMSSFKSVPFQYVLDELERQYDIEIIYVGSQKNKLFTGGFVHNNLKNALNSITQPLVQTYKITSNQVLITDE